MSDRSSGVIILGILAVTGLGLSGFMFVKNEIMNPSGNPTLKAKAYKGSSLQAFLDNVYAQVTFESESYDVGNYFNLDTNTYVVPKDGYYQIYASVFFYYVDAGEHYIIRVRSTSNEFLLYAGQGCASSPGWDLLSINIADIAYLHSGENITLEARKSGGSAQIYGNTYGSYTFLTILLLE